MNEDNSSSIIIYELIVEANELNMQTNEQISINWNVLYDRIVLLFLLFEAPPLERKSVCHCVFYT